MQKKYCLQRNNRPIEPLQQPLPVENLTLKLLTHLFLYPIITKIEPLKLLNHLFLYPIITHWYIELSLLHKKKHVQMICHTIDWKLVETYRLSEQPDDHWITRTTTLWRAHTCYYSLLPVTGDAVVKKLQTMTLFSRNKSKNATLQLLITWAKRYLVQFKAYLLDTTLKFTFSRRCSIICIIK